MRRCVVGVAAVIAALVVTVPAWADYSAGQKAWEAGRFAEAVSEWETAAAEGDRWAMVALGHVYKRGVGAPQDYILAHLWFNLAASQGDVQAAAERDALAEQMSLEEQAEARKLLREWRRKLRTTVEVDEPASAPSEAESDTGSPPPRAIKEAQSLLTQLGYAPGLADGIWGRRTAEAYQAFLRDAGLPTADMLTPKALHAMRETVANQGQVERPAQTAAAQPGDALHRAAKVGDLDGLRIALETGVDVNARDGHGWTALMHAANKGYTLLVSPLLKARADPDVQAADGATALFVAAVHGHSEIIALLMNAGADYSIKGPKDRTAADVARVKYGGLDTAKKNDERDEVLALLQHGIRTPDEIERTKERSQRAIEYELANCEETIVGLLYNGTYHFDLEQAEFVQDALEIHYTIEYKYPEESNIPHSKHRMLAKFNLHDLTIERRYGAFVHNHHDSHYLLFVGNYEVGYVERGTSERSSYPHFPIACNEKSMERIVENFNRIKRLMNRN